MLRFKFILFIVLAFTACKTDILDKKPLKVVTDADVWNSQGLIDSYVANLYENLPIGFGASVLEAHLTDEASHPYLNTTITSNYGTQAAANRTGYYTPIRRVNYMLQMLPTSALNQLDRSRYTAEAYFIRAYYYFELVKKYGGVPIIRVPQSPDSSIEELQVPRNTEQETYDFILEDLNKAVADLPESWLDGANAKYANRATKYAALALKARAMLYAGTIAKYGTVQLNGLAGIPSQESTRYLTQSMEAADAVIQSKKFALYDRYYNPLTKSGDPIQNFQNIFLDENNKEVIFQKVYALPDFGHSYDYYNAALSFGTGSFGNVTAVTLNFVEYFENIDGSSGVLDVANKEFANPTDLFANKDPRFKASVLYPGAPWKGRTVQIWRGIYDQDDANKLYQLSNAATFKGVPQVGADGPFPTGDVGKTGFYVKKYMNPATSIITQNQSDQNYIDFRYAEILVSYAEAATELGVNQTQALDCINQLRARAGIKILTSAELDLARIRNERTVELAFENKRFWDIRRWRIGTTLFAGTFMKGLWPYQVHKGGVFKYIFTKVTGTPIDNGQSRTFNVRDYYSNISGYMVNNKNIVNNPFY